MIIRLVTNTLVNNRTFVIPYLMALCAGTLAMSFWEKEALFFKLHNLHTPYTDIFFKYLTHLGDGLFLVVVIIFLAFIHFGKAAFLFLAFLLSGILAQFLKKIIFPDALRPKGWFGSESSLQAIEGVDLNIFYSFPSGHTVTAFSACFAIAIMLRNKAWGYVMIIAAIFIGYSRIYLGQHFFEDVYYGSLIGMVSAIIVWTFFYRQMDKPWAEKSLLNLRS